MRAKKQLENFRDALLDYDLRDLGFLSTPFSLLFLVLGCGH